MNHSRFHVGLSRRLYLPLLSVFLLGIAFLTLTTLPVQAATTWTVSPNNLGTCTAANPNCATVSAAIRAAAANDIVQIGPGTYTENITVNKDLTFVGAGAGVTILDGGYGAGCTGQAPLSKTVVFIRSGVTMHMSDLTIQHGCVIGNGTPILEGGGVHNDGTTYLSRVIVQENMVRGPQGGGGGIANETKTGALFLTDVILANNVAEEGGGLDNDRVATLTNVSIFGNTAMGNRNGDGNGGGIENGTLAGATITMTNVTIFANTAKRTGGAISSDAASVINATNVTLNLNSAPHFGGIDSHGVVNIKSSIVANSAGGNCSRPLTATGQNLSTDGSCGAGFVVNPNPGLASALAANGAFAPTDALLPGSPALKAIANCTTGICDLGSFAASPIIPQPVAAPPLVPGTPTAEPSASTP
jgi:hypothetical protein